MSPVDQVASRLHKDCPVCAGESSTCFHLEMLQRNVKNVLSAATAEGWRIVKTNGGGSTDDPDWGPVTFVYVDEEWTP